VASSRPAATGQVCGVEWGGIELQVLGWNSDLTVDGIRERRIDARTRFELAAR